ncbi:PREDICTED: protein NEN1-like [Ipomoea nil]|uniref:protein NEN1-like n=1 Tax=Ipomoea nil TaxID=35883 RepID=UPI0009016C84|nr:PREDICTED: protein NEN1-like [Ipomoea nil]XP_019167000.1 PREDICTED: protein NEN1-like [Ipomoea nil]
MMMAVEDATEIAFFDVETTIPTRPGQGFALLEFGGILVCPRKLVELESYSTLIRPADPSLITTLSVRCNGITKDAVASAPAFADIADKVYDFLHGRIWAGHNILKFDCPRIREAFAAIDRPAPEPKGTMDSLVLLTQRFGRRAGNMKMATLATYFGLGEQTHRSLDDVRMNFEVLKCCATVLFLESSLLDNSPENTWVSPNSTTRSRSNGKASMEGAGLNPNTPSSSLMIGNVSPNSTTRNHSNDKASLEGAGLNPNTPSSSLMIGNVSPNTTTRNHSNGKASLGGADLNAITSSSSLMIENGIPPMENRSTKNRRMLSSTTLGRIEDLSDHVESVAARPDPFNMGPLSDEMEKEFLESDDMDEEESDSPSQVSSTATESVGSSSCTFLEPDEISMPSISVALAPSSYYGMQKIKILHNHAELQICCKRMKVRFGISTKFLGPAGRPRLSFVVNASESLCRILDAIDKHAQNLSVDSGSSSEWRPLVTRKPGFMKFPTIRFNIPTVVNGDTVHWATEIYQKEASNTQKLVFSRFDVEELDALITTGTCVDAYISLDAYDYQQNAGIRLVANKLILHCN